MWFEIVKLMEVRALLVSWAVLPSTHGAGRRYSTHPRCLVYYWLLRIHCLVTERLGGAEEFRERHWLPLSSLSNEDSLG